MKSKCLVAGCKRDDDTTSYFRQDRHRDDKQGDESIFSFCAIYPYHLAIQEPASQVVLPTRQSSSTSTANKRVANPFDNTNMAPPFIDFLGVGAT